jgi:hypothetical protein
MAAIASVLLLAQLAATTTATYLQSSPDFDRRLTNITVDYTPYIYSVVDHGQPLFGWVVQVGVGGREMNGLVQRSYRVRVTRRSGSSRARCWDSGVVASNATMVAFPAADAHGGVVPLLPDCSYSLDVQVLLSDGTNRTGEASFMTGLMSTSSSAWDGAEWLTGTPALEPARNRRNNLRATWHLTDAPSSATALVAG